MIKRIYESNNVTAQEAANVAFNDAKQIFRDIMDDSIDKQSLLVDVTHLVQVLKELCKLLETKKENRSGHANMIRGINEDVEFKGIPNVLGLLDNYISELDESGGIKEEFIYQWVDDLLNIRNDLQANYNSIKKCARDIGLYNL